ncbi:phosphate/phosphite/phosphonate ABC transporter substrate-binding protein [Leptothoe spongobia]|uniref:Phosphate/phosphite/phosphonate ABC transporter substrate-binding protein n=1 Tax=Leptothoe spongobia TAU-MAC 1115 TaxID=1967444 RepID=A0A947DF04_9CYAN|nr:phosphate/phosphite/phosphonate ABC transporter substrate-binding protein [Leptothoe spongobia]MBT9315194.1 phosphate/phosphite/phosphonate ABC transporter substrate-binding protein [Leptothoe spongobia TAU-MAC 1115]
MLNKLTSSLLLTSSIIFLAGCGFSQADSTPKGASGGESIILTDVDFDPESLIPETQPMADYLASKLKKVGVTQGEVKIAPDVDTVAEWMASGEVNLYFDSVFPAMQVMEKSGATPILRRWKDGVPEYNTLFIARQDSDLSDLASLQGKMMAMQKPSSSSGFMFPLIELMDNDLTPVTKAEANHPVDEDEIGYIFSGEDETTVEWVLNGKVQAGAVDSETWAEVSDADRAQLMVITETPKYPRHMVVVGPSLSDQQIAAVKDVLLDMETSQKGRAALVEFSETAEFDEFPEGVDEAILKLQDSYNRVQEHLAAQQISS